ncbi:DNA-binding response regulator [Bowdeniella nasicola]|uniref:DNA-binding response regulator n=1 Tax=Bowdeniella nasicola TaxID=208480 RepID=A0A1Q5Q1Y4_9ACTO|nr:response regulator transcription factor [Bowdeniella nasicola]OKL53883.1 DNA-binding response regulator [Bowdeniella nasicola]
MTSPTPLRVVLADDQYLVRAGIVSLLGLDTSITVVAEASDGEEALTAIAEHRPDVLLLDLRMPRLDGIGVLKELQAGGNSTPVLVLTTFDDDEQVVAAMRAGARGYLLKDVTLEELTTALREVAAGKRYIQPAITATLVAHFADPPTAQGPALIPQLTDRERDVLRLMAAGWANREIAESLHLAQGTVKNHVSAIMDKLGVRDRTKAVLRALELGLLSGN